MPAEHESNGRRSDAIVEAALERVLRGEALDVEVLLDGHRDLSDSECRRIRAAVAVLAPGEASAPATPAAQPDSTGAFDELHRRFGAYELVRELGRGGQGVVFLARDTRLGRNVALKILNRGDFTFERTDSSSGPAARLKREAEVASKLDHPGICVVHELGVEDGRPFIAMRYVEGETLARRIVAARESGRALRIATQSALEDDDASTASVSSQRRHMLRIVQLVERVARALHVAHQAQVIHRDIKPANIMITPAGEPVILDFGLARDEESEAPTLTLSGDVVGSPSYMSPEQIDTHRGVLDARTDVYSLGVVLYECLTLHRPFEAPTREGLYRAILNDPPPSAHALVRSIPRDLATVLATALEKDLGRRYASALDLAEDLRRVRELEPILARPAGPLLRFRRWTQRSPGVAASIAGAFVALLATIGVLKWMLVREEAQRLLAQSAGYCPVDPARALRCAEQAADLGAPEDAALEINLLNALSELREVRCVPGHSQQVDTAQLSADGRWLATASRDGLVRLWDARSWTKVHELSGFHSRPRIALSPNGRWLATESDKDGAQVWDVSTWSAHALDQPAHRGSLAFSPDSTRIAFVLDDGREARILPADPAAGGEAQRIEAGSLACINTVLWSPDSAWICVTGSTGYRLCSNVEPPIERLFEHAPSWWLFDFSRDGTLVLLPTEHEVECFDRKTKRVIDSYPPAGSGNHPPLQLARLDPFSRRVLLAYEDGGAELYDRDGAACPLSLHVGGASISDAAFSRDGSKVLMMRNALSPIVCDAHTGAKLAELSTAPGDAALIALWDEEDGEAPCITFHLSGAMRRWRLASGWERTTFPGFGTDGIAFDPSAEHVLVACPSSAQLLDWRARRPVREFDTEGGTVRAVAFSPDGRSIAIGTRTDCAFIRDAATGSLLRKWRHPDEVWSVEFSPDGRWLASACSDGLVHVLDIAADLELAPFRGHGGGVRSVAFDARGEHIVSVSESDGCVRVWECARRRTVAQHYISKYLGEADNHAPLYACFARDGRHVAISSYDGTVRIWDTATDEIDERKLCDRATHFLEYSPDGRWLAVAADDRIVHLLEVGGARRAVPLVGHRGGVQSVRYSRDGRLLVSQDGLGELHVWRTDVLAAAREALRDIADIPLSSQ
jgi:serine/threonine protein kinase/WD40 repeat protein